jgi:hypothetical protein
VLPGAWHIPELDFFTGRSAAIAAIGIAQISANMSINIFIVSFFIIFR